MTDAELEALCAVAAGTDVAHKALCALAHHTIMGEAT